VATVDVDFDEIERSLPEGAAIKHQTVQTVVEGGKFIVYGEYTIPGEALEEAVAKEAINIEEVLGDEGMLPSVN